MAKAEKQQTCSECDGSGLVIDLAEELVPRRAMMLGAFHLGTLPRALRVRPCPSCAARKAAEAKAAEGKKG